MDIGPSNCSTIARTFARAGKSDCRHSLVLRISELRRRLIEHFGPDWAPSYARDFVIAELGGQTIDQALANGLEPSDIWRAVVKQNPEIKPELR